MQRLLIPYAGEKKVILLKNHDNRRTTNHLGKKRKNPSRGVRRNRTYDSPTNPFKSGPGGATRGEEETSIKLRNIKFNKRKIILASNYSQTAGFPFEYLIYICPFCHFLCPFFSNLLKTTLYNTLLKREYPAPRK